MKINYIQSESTIKPDPISIEKTVVYLRKNIIEDVYTNIEGKSIVLYIYQEAKLTHEEFSKYSNELLAINAVKGVNDSNNIAQLVTEGANSTNNQLILMEAIADLYDAIASK